MSSIIKPDQTKTVTRFRCAQNWVAFRNWHGDNETCAPIDLNAPLDLSKGRLKEKAKLDLAEELIFERALAGNILLFGYRVSRKGLVNVNMFYESIPIELLQNIEKIGNFFGDPLQMDIHFDSDLYYLDVVLYVEEIMENWPQKTHTPIKEAEHSIQKPSPSTIGRPAKYDWNAFYYEIIRIANQPDGLPERQTELENKMKCWCLNKWGNEPSGSTIRGKISPIYQKVRN